MDNNIKPDWVVYKDYDPDKQRSSSGLWAEDRGADVVWVLQVKDHGVIVMRATPAEDGDTISFNSVSTFSDAEIGWRK